MGDYKEALAFLTGKTYYLATVEGGKPRVRPFGLVMDLNGRLYFGTAVNKPCFSQMLACPQVEISATSDDGRDWLRLSGTVAYDDDDATREAFFDAHPFLRDMYGQPDSPKLAPFYFTVGEAAFETMGGERRTTQF